MVLGIDAGSTHYKLVWVEGEEVVNTLLLPTRPAMEDLLREHLSNRPVASISIATGYGRHALVESGIAQGAITEIKAQAMGVARLFPGASTILDLGGQDFKVIKVSGGKVVDFEMNDRCAAGTGRFIEMAANRLGVSLQGLDRLAGGCQEATRLNSMCAVFAESELVSLMARGEPVESIARGVLQSIAQRLVAMVKRVNGRPPLVFTGGGGCMTTLVELVSSQLGHVVQVPPEPLFTAALGAAAEGEKRMVKV